MDPREPSTCTRCHLTDRPDRFRMSLVNLAREAVHDGSHHTGHDYAFLIRCTDREACSERVRRQRENR